MEFGFIDLQTKNLDVKSSSSSADRKQNRSLTKLTFSLCKTVRFQWVIKLPTTSLQCTVVYNDYNVHVRAHAHFNDCCYATA